jgi:hypothetical protein
MPNVRIVVAQGAIDGVNTTFSTGVPYVPGSTAYILNGRIHNKALSGNADYGYGYVELDPDAGTIQVENPPLPGDLVQIFFWDRVVLPAPPVGQITGTVATGPGAPIQGTVRTVQPTRLVGVVGPRTLQGVVRPERPEQLIGTVGTNKIVGIVREKCP